MAATASNTTPYLTKKKRMKRITFINICIKKEEPQTVLKEAAPVNRVLFDSNKQPESFPLQALYYKSLSGFFSCVLYKFPF